MSGKIFSKANKSNSETGKSIPAKSTNFFKQSHNSHVDLVMHLQRTVGNQAVGRMLNSGIIQAKLKIGNPNDKYEQEAEQVAKRITTMPDMSTENQTCRFDGAEKLQLLSQNSSPGYFNSTHDEMAGKKLSRKSLQRGMSDAGNEIESGLYQSKGNGNPLPRHVKEEMEHKIGASFGSVRVHTDSGAVRMSEQLGARAFTRGSDIYFGKEQFNTRSAEGKQLLAHELAHTVQQQGGSKTIQRYAIVAGERISDDGKMVVKDHTKNAWALETDIDKSNAVLSGIKSERTLKKLGSKRKVKKPGGTNEHELTKYEVDAPNLKKNCGRAALQMLGHNVTGERKFVAVTNKKTTQEFTKTINYHGDDQAPGPPLSTTEELSTEIYIKIFREKEGKNYTRAQALAAWKNLSASKLKAYSTEYGINEYAVPRVGQAITMGTEFDMPGFKTDSQLGRPNSTWNFHFGTPVITSGHDYTTAENFTGSSHDYYFSMMGPHSKGQSWYDEQKTAGFGNRYTAMVVQHPETLTGEINTNKVILVQSPERFNKDGSGVISKLARATGVTIIRKGKTWMKVEVTTGSDTGKKGWILNKYFKDS